MHEAIICKLENIQPIKGADRIVSAYVSTSVPIAQVVVSKDHYEGEVGIYFPPDVQLSQEYCDANDLIARYDEHGVKIGGGYFNEKRRVVAQRFKGVRSDGIWMPLESLNYVDDTRIQKLPIGSTLNYWQRSDGVNFPLCEKYFSEKTLKIRQEKTGKKTREMEFPKHQDTAQLIHEIGMIPIGAKYYLSEKLHGTSQRYGYVEVEQTLTRLQKLINMGAKIVRLKEVYPSKKFEYVYGTRNVVIYPEKEGFHGNEQFRFDAVGNPQLKENEVVYGEIVGYANNKSIMPAHDPKDLKEVRKLFGDTIVYDYGESGTCRFYVYHIKRMINGIWVDYTYEEMAQRCKELGFAYIEYFEKGIFTDPEELMRRVILHTEGSTTFQPSLYGNHPSEGTVVRVEYNGLVKFYKYKSFAFKVMEGIIKEQDIIDPEEIS